MAGEGVYDGDGVTRLGGICVSGYVSRLSCIFSFRVHVKLFYRIVSYRIVTYMSAELSMGWVDPWAGLGWVGLG